MLFNWWLSKWTDAFSELGSNSPAPTPDGGGAEASGDDDDKLGDFELSLDT